MSSLEPSNNESSLRKRSAVDFPSSAAAAAAETAPIRVNTLNSGDSTVHLTLMEETQQKLADDFVRSIMINYKQIPTSDKIPEDGENPENRISGMSVLHNVVNLETGDQVTIVIRSITEPFWQACIDTVDTLDKRYRVCVVGTPGIGKTTATPILIRMLLKKEHTVVYLIRTANKSGWYYEFTPNKESDTTTTKLFRERKVGEDIASLFYSSTYYVVDPGKTKDSCDPEDTFKAKVILVSSPDECH
jgi:hypothetical protein